MTHGAPGGGHDLHLLPLSESALALGNGRAANIVALGVFAGLAGACRCDTLEAVIRDGVPPRFLDLNLRAFARGLELCEKAASALT